MPAKLYQNDEAALTWLNTGGTELFTGTSVADGAGRQGAMHDFGSSARSERFAWRAFVQCAATPTVGEVIRVYWKSGSGATAGARPDNDDGTGDIAVSAEDKLRNLQFLGNIVVDQGAANIEFVASGEMTVPARWGGPVFWNESGASLTSDATEHGFELVPIPMESQ